MLFEIFNKYLPRLVPAVAGVLALTAPVWAQTLQEVIVVVGAEGEPQFAPQFRQWAERWSAAATKGQAKCTTIGLESAAKPDRALLQEALAAQTEATNEPLWIVLIGHGTFDGKTARFNMRGEDFSPADLSAWLKPLQRPVAIVNCASASGPFLTELAAPQRVVVTAAKSGHEYNFARFGDHISQAITDPSADLDKDEQVSLLEAYLVAAAKVREFYTSESRLATEHALLDDNGDRLGTPADWFSGLRATKSAKAGASLDGALARTFILVRSGREEVLPADSRAKRDELEQKLAELRAKKGSLPEADYFAELEPILVELSRLYP
jgi:hypothetical protein